MKNEKKALFEGIESEVFQREVKKFTSKEQFKDTYNVEKLVDVSDRANVGMIRIEDTSHFKWGHTALLKSIGEISDEVKQLTEDLKNGKPTIPLVVERSDNLADFTKGSKVGYLELSNTDLVDAYYLAEIKYIPAIVYENITYPKSREYSSEISMIEFLKLDFDKLYDDVHSPEEENENKITALNENQSPEETFQLMKGKHYDRLFPEDTKGKYIPSKKNYIGAPDIVEGTLDNAIRSIRADIAARETNSKGGIFFQLPTLTRTVSDSKALENLQAVLAQAKSTEMIDPSQMQSFDDTLTKYNKEISEEEMKAWIWYQRREQFYLDESKIISMDSGWSKFVISRNEEEEKIKQWVEMGLLCYHKGTFIPKVLYYSGNIYNRISQLLVDSTTIKEKYGQEFYDNQWNGLEEVKPKRLTLIDPVIENRLTIKPISDLAKEIRIGGLADGTMFKEQDRSTYQMRPVKYSLRAAFTEWLQNVPRDQFNRTTAFEISRYYIQNQSLPRQKDKTESLRLKENARNEGDRLFDLFLSEAITREDQTKIEHIWNSRFNGYVPVNYFKVPIAFDCSSTFKNAPLFVRDVQRGGLGYLAINGSGCIAYDVGLGKTMTGILSIAQAIQSGMCSRPLIIVPNQTYESWLTELSGKKDRDGEIELTGVLPQYKVNDLYNLSEIHINRLRNKNGKIVGVEENSISIITYEGMRKLAFNQETWEEVGRDFYKILNQGDSMSDRDKSALYEKVRMTMGFGMKDSMLEIEDLGFDFMLLDEAHNSKKIFTQVKGRMDVTSENREKKRYQISSGMPSSIGIKTFMLAQYFLKRNKNKNVVLLTATPFTNSPLEIYSMLALLGFQNSVDPQIADIHGFFNHFIKSSLVLTINAKMKPERKEIVLGFNNLIALQQLVFRFIDYKTGEEANIQRPDKWTLPLTHRNVGGKLIALPREQQVSTNLPMTAKQKELMYQVEQYITGDITFSDFCLNPDGLEDSDDKNSGATALSESSMSDDEMEGARILRGISLARQIAFSPYLCSCFRFNAEEVDYLKFVESSPKLMYVMGCIKSVKKFHEDRNEKVSGQIIYSNAGVGFFPWISEYLVKELGFKESEVGFIIGGMSSQRKEVIKNKFLKGDIKILLGSKSIKEGINLQSRATVLYNLWLDWNPTDLKQLEGRIWRFGNEFANVRIVLPLMEDSIDTAIFQKLEEKTSRINEIWHRSGGENTLKLEEFNPAELKMGLITNPMVLAEITLMEEREIIKDEIARLTNQVDELQDIRKAKDTFDQHYQEISDRVAKYKPQKEDAPARKVQTILRIYREIFDDKEVRLSFLDESNYEECRRAFTLINNAKERILAPRGLTLDFNEAQVIGKIQSEVETQTIELEAKTGKEAVEELSREIIRERAESGYQPKSVDERVSEFASLNPKLLTEKMIYPHSKQLKLLPVEQRKGKEKRIILTPEESLAYVQEILKESEEIEKMLIEIDSIRKNAA